MTSIASNLGTVTINDPEMPKQWWALQVFNFYRISLAATLLIIGSLEFSQVYVGSTDHDLFHRAMLTYLLFGFSVFLASYKRYPSFRTQVTITTLMDIAALLLLLHASGGVSSGLGILLNIAIAGSCILSPGRLSLFFAAVASAGLLVQHGLFYPEGFTAATGYMQAGIHGASFFATAILAHVLSERIRASETLAHQRSHDLANLELLNDLIIQRLHSGIIVVDGEWRVRLINDTARHLLGVPHSKDLADVREISDDLTEQLSGWRTHATSELRPFRTLISGPEVAAQFTPLDTGTTKATIIFIDDMTRMAQQAQHMKLASLGRFTASIAHELRNPLGAIGHAVQLLEESSQLRSDDLRLAEIIREHSERMNNVINNILQLSRRKHTTPSTINLKHWLEFFVNDFKRQLPEEPDITIDVSPEDIMALMDISQLQQVLTNLCENGLRYSKQETGKATLLLRGKIVGAAAEPVLEIIDKGLGVSSEDEPHLFEPFYTTERMGTGLGLYIARELCEANQARLDYIPQEKAGACFRITFHEVEKP